MFLAPFQDMNVAPFFHLDVLYERLEYGVGDIVVPP